MLTRHLTSALTSTQDTVPDFDAEGVYLFLTRDNVELRAKMLDFLKACVMQCCKLHNILLMGRRCPGVEV